MSKISIQFEDHPAIGATTVVLKAPEDFNIADPKTPAEQMAVMFFFSVKNALKQHDTKHEHDKN